MRTCTWLVAAALLVGAVGCAGFYVAPVMPPGGLIFSAVKAPMGVEFNNTSVPGKTGVASSSSILGLIAFGDASSKTAAQSAGITRIDHADYEMFNVLGVYSKFTTVVHGQ